MGPTRRHKSTSQYDPELYENWTILRLKEELRKRGIQFPINARRMALVRLIKNHEMTNDSQFNNVNGQPSQSSILGNRRQQQFLQHDIDSYAHVNSSLLGSARSHDSADAGGVANARENNVGNESARSHDAANVDNNGGDHSNRVLIGLVSKLSSTVQSLQHDVLNLTGKVNSIAHRNQQPSNSNIDYGSVEICHNTSTTTGTTRNIDTPTATAFNLETAFQALRDNRPVPSAAAGSEEQLNSNLFRTARGYAAESLPFVETISPQLRKNIIAGNDINLASLLIPYYSGTGINESNFSDDKTSKPDPRTNTSLSIGEFIQAFSVYKNIMCSAYPHRRSELDLYERDIVDMASRYSGRGFYEYHKKFSADAAAHLRYNNTKVDWSIRNNTLFCNIFSNTRPNACNVCGSTFHGTGFCGQSVSAHTNKYYVNQRQSDSDTHGRERINYLGREICNNFNGARGCMNPKCRNFHICLLCKGEHSRMSCSQAKNEGVAPQKIGAINQRK